MARLTTLLFDAGGTLVHPNWQRVADAFSAAGAPIGPQVLEAADARVRFDLDRPDLVATTRDSHRWHNYLE